MFSGLLFNFCVNRVNIEVFSCNKNVQYIKVKLVG